jgi:hypothetical protein
LRRRSAGRYSWRPRPEQSRRESGASRHLRNPSMRRRIWSGVRTDD